MAMEKINVPTVKEAVYRKLLAAIVSGKIPPGTSLTTQELADQFGVSLMPVREALRKLEAERFISVLKNRRIVVQELSVQELQEILKIRLDLEQMAAREAVEHITEEEIAELEELMEAVKQADHPDDFLAKNYKFHHTIYEAARMPVLDELIRNLWMRVSPYLHVYTTSTPDYRTLKVHYHEGIIQGLKDRNPEVVCDWLSQDLRRAADLVSGVLTKSDMSELIEALES